MMPGTDIEAVRGVLERHPELELAIVFGSVASGSARADSDLDLAVSAGSPLSTEARIALIEELAAATGRPVDLVDLTLAGEPLLGEIVSNGRRLTGSDEAYASLVTRHLFDKADFLPYRDRILAERRQAWIDG
ncbi:Nucleotidyltransferase domain-containing protein [Thiohalospira halophila DSM 15071]|uniref:Nucleotidyltransferase domain-containing protein n=1 Tax=Thiohalospira halophila DSM 15071 TaxID=1123397 RepID=A0A1I1NHY9_9GAMM|nr:nucleotidyltransferase domain-containing protein [Thiohalospira halophila]SFC97046.1 Nucleotidyltransferase domain-containing protein [Thiohalospira halophila DSM 15071]